VAGFDEGASVREVVGVGAPPDGALPALPDGVGVGFEVALVVGVAVVFGVAGGRGVGVGSAQRRAISLSCSIVTRAASTLATSMPAVTWAW